MKKFGLIGYPLGHSFSKKYYLEKIHNEQIAGINYDLYPIEDIGLFPQLYQKDTSFAGFNVTIPYKQSVMAYMDELSPEALAMGAVNCVKVSHSDAGPYLKGFNTDAYGFEKSLIPQLDRTIHTSALVLGNGGAAQAVLYTLKKLGIGTQLVSRKKSDNMLTYQELTTELVQNTKLIVNCTPLGTFPNVDECPDIPYGAIGRNHYLYDLIYNPEETLFLKKGRDQGAITKNGYEMLILQAERNWELWAI